MLFGCIVTNLKSTFDSPVCEFTAKTGKGGIVSRCRCNIFTIGNRFTGSFFCFSISNIHNSFAFSALTPVHIRIRSIFKFEVLFLFWSIAFAHEYSR